MQRDSSDPRFHNLPARRVGPVRAVAAVVLLALGGSLVWMSQLCLGLAQRWGGQHTLDRWGTALDGFQSTPARSARIPAWERLLLRVGPPVLLSIGGALVLLWTLLLLGGALSWLAWRGYGFAILLTTVALGAALGSSLTLLRRRAARQDRLN